MTPRISEAIDIFLKAIENGTLAKGTCAACAVGNLVASGLNAKIYKDFQENFFCEKNNSEWIMAFVAYDNYQSTNKNKFNDILVLNNINATKFSLKELMIIEYTFEKNTKYEFSSYDSITKEEIRKDQINGLEAVIQVMLDFDNCIDNLVKEVFTKKAELIEI